MFGKYKITLDNDTKASNEGEIRFNPLVWARYDTRMVVCVTWGLVVLILLTIFSSTDYLIMLIAAIILNFFYWVGSMEHFSVDSNGGIIVSVNPPLAAVMTNLAKYDGNYPVIKIIDYKVKREISIGDRIGTVATYKQGKNERLPHWDDFSPIPIEYCTNDQVSIDIEMNFYTEQQWEDTERGIQKIEKPFKVALYRFDLEQSDWKRGVEA